MSTRLLAVARTPIWSDPRRLPAGDFRAAIALRWALNGTKVVRS